MRKKLHGSSVVQHGVGGGGDADLDDLGPPRLVFHVSRKVITSTTSQNHMQEASKKMDKKNMDNENSAVQKNQAFDFLFLRLLPLNPIWAKERNDINIPISRRVCLSSEYIYKNKIQ